MVTASSYRFGLRRAAAMALAMAVAFQMALVSSASAQARLSLVRDAEIEALVREYARPIFAAAGLSKSNIDIILVNDPSFNAFVAGRRIPSVQDGDGNRAPQVGFLLHLTDAEAKYELLQGSIEPAETLKPGSKPAKSEAKEM